MSEFKIISGTNSFCERELNRLKYENIECTVVSSCKGNGELTIIIKTLKQVKKIW